VVSDPIDAGIALMVERSTRNSRRALSDDATMLLMEHHPPSS
jgi:hypothetical protein